MSNEDEIKKELNAIKIHLIELSNLLKAFMYSVVGEDGESEELTLPRTNTTQLEPFENNVSVDEARGYIG